jgi:ferritin-like metal-binding protein YciE
MSDRDKTIVIGSPEQLAQPATRRSFMRMLGIGGSIVLLPSVFAACSDDDDDIVGGGGTNTGTVTLNLAGDIGIINYAYALEQLEAAFYTQVLAATAFAGLTANDREMLTDIRNHEVIHRDFLARALGDAKIPNLAVNFGAAFASRDSILSAAQTFEDLGVAAYNGAGKFLANANNLLVAGKIVSVEARHAAAIRDARDSAGTLFADLTTLTTFGAVPANGLDGAQEPAFVLGQADAFITTTVQIGSQPTP